MGCCISTTMCQYWDKCLIYWGVYWLFYWHVPIVTHCCATVTTCLTMYSIAEMFAGLHFRGLGAVNISLNTFCSSRCMRAYNHSHDNISRQYFAVGVQSVKTTKSKLLENWALYGILNLLKLWNIQGCTWVCRSIQGCTRVHRNIQKYGRIVRGAHEYAEVSRGAQECVVITKSTAMCQYCTDTTVVLVNHNYY